MQTKSDSAFMANLRKRLPSATSAAQAYALLVLMLYGWTLYRFVWKIPAWVYSLTLGEIAQIYAYALSVNLLESAAALALLLLISFLLPPAWLTESFAARSAAFLFPLLIYLMALSNHFESAIEKYYPQTYLQWLPAAIVGSLALAWLAGKWNPLRRALEDLTARAVIFLYIFMPLSALTLLYVIFINILRSVPHG